MLKKHWWVPALACAWGWSEATWFFIVPDFWLSFTVFWGPRVALVSIGAAALGAVLGSTTYYGLGDSGREMLHSWWSHTPGFAEEMFKEIHRHLHEGLSGLRLGPWQGLPYRYYLKEVHTMPVSLPQVWLWTLVARIPRLCMAPILCGSTLALLEYQARQLELKVPLRPLLVGLFLLLWAMIYYDYWFVFVPRSYPPAALGLALSVRSRA